MGQAELETRRYTPEEYFALEKKSDVRHEYLEGEIFAMAGASKAHNLLAQNVALGLRMPLAELYDDTGVAPLRLSDLKGQEF